MTSLAGRILAAIAPHISGPVFGLPGVHNLPFWRETGGDLPRIVVPRHEQTVGYAADAAARVSGRIGVALTTTGPGAANALTAFGEAAASHSRVLLVASEVSTSLTGLPVLHAMPGSEPAQSALFRPLARAWYAPRTLDDAIAAAADAVAAVTSGPPGPVYLGVPTDLLGAAAPEIPVEPRVSPPPRPADLAAAVAVLDAADRVVIWAGGGAADAAGSVRRLAETLQAPVVTTFTGSGVLPGDHPLAVPLPPHEPEVAALIAAADVLLVVGSDLDGTTTRNWGMPRPPWLVRVDVDPGQVDAGWPPDAAVVGDAQVVLDGLRAAVAPRDRPQQDLAPVAAARTRLADNAPTADAMTLVTAVDAATAAMAEPPAVVCDMAVAGYWVGGYATARRPRRLLYPVGWGTLGFALPAAVGAATVAGPTLAVAGDAGVLFGIGELATLAQERLPVTVLVVDDAGYGMLRYDQDRVGERRSGVDLTPPDFVALAAAFGIAADLVEDVERDLADSLVAALTCGDPRLVVVKAGLTPPRTTSPLWHDPV